MASVFIELTVGEYADVWDLAFRRWRAAEITSVTSQQYYYRAVDDHRTDMVSRGSERIHLYVRHHNHRYMSYQFVLHHMVMIWYVMI